MNNDPQHPTEQFLRGIDIHELLPQQEPFVMIGRMTYFDMSRTITETVINGENIFVDDGRFSATGLVENIAQTCAARIGYINKYILKKGIQLGFIGAVKKMDIMAPPQVGDTIETEIETVAEVLGMILAKGIVRCSERVLVTTDIKIAIKEES